ncbi:MAG: hypothetical protein JW836_15305 [Deltaproteobacteria bacterium]|nr:hypothetical protein [Deltaproteobacteria bacterium]
MPYPGLLFEPVRKSFHIVGPNEIDLNIAGLTLEYLAFYVVYVIAKLCELPDVGEFVGKGCTATN